MAYNNTIPKATDKLKDSQGQLLANFQAIQTLVEVNHETFGAANEGKHKFISMPVQSPAPTFSAGEVGQYSFLNTTTNKNELYINKTNNSGVVQIAATSSILGTTNPTPGSFGNTGWTMLPSGIKLVWGVFTGSGSGAQTVSITGDQQFATTMLSVQLTIAGNSTTAVQALARIRSISANSFSAVVSNVTGTTFNSSQVSYLAIGY